MPKNEDTKSAQREQPPPMARPRPERLVEGEVRPERPVESGRTDRRADEAGIEIDHAGERPAD